jgi:membrane-bound inhibitor of C-type lysozyme
MNFAKRKYAGNSRYAPAKKMRRPAVRGLYSKLRYVRTASARYAAAPRTIELKYNDANINEVSTNGGQTFLLLNCANGTGATDRIGRSISLHDCHFSYRVIPNANTTGSWVRILLVYDTQTNGAVPGATDVLDSAAITSNANANNRTRFKFLYDKSHFIAANSTATQAVTFYDKPTTVMNQQCSLKGKKVEFMGTTNAITDIDKGGIFLVYIGTDTAVLTVFNFRTQFFDQ